jgi:hypothetical protein
MLVLTVVAGAVAGCGSAGLTATPAAQRGPGVQSPAPGGPSGRPPIQARRADAATVSVIQGWSDTLRRGDVRGAARYFAVPSLMINGRSPDGEPYVTAIRNFDQAVTANASLPCGAQLISAVRYGHYVNALFRLTDRQGQGGGCGPGAGSTARTNFLIKHGRIVEWIRAPNRPGENGGSGPNRAPQV